VGGRISWQKRFALLKVGNSNAYFVCYDLKCSLFLMIKFCLIFGVKMKLGFTRTLRLLASSFCHADFLSVTAVFR